MNDKVKKDGQNTVENSDKGSKSLDKQSKNATQSNEAKKDQKPIVDEQKAKAEAEEKAAKDKTEAEEKSKLEAEEKAEAEAKSLAEAEATALKSGGAIVRSRLDHAFTLSDGTVVPPMVGDKRGSVAVKSGSECENHNVVKQLIKNGFFEVKYNDAEAE